jgi:hypothetical protein
LGALALRPSEEADLRPLSLSVAIGHNKPQYLGKY